MSQSDMDFQHKKEQTHDNGHLQTWVCETPHSYWSHPGSRSQAGQHWHQVKVTDPKKYVNQIWTLCIVPCIDKADQHAGRHRDRPKTLWAHLFDWEHKI